MKKTIFAVFLCVAASLAFGQNTVTKPFTGVFLTAAPTGDCRLQYYDAVIDNSTQNAWVCNPSTGVWTAEASASVVVASGKILTISNTLTLAGTDSTTMTFPGTSDTVVTLGATQVLTGKTLTAPTVNNPVITGPAPVACGATCSPTAGQLILLNQAGGSAATLPTSSGSGNVIRMRVTVATTSAQDKVLLTTTSDVIIGTATGENAGTAKVFVGNAGTFHSIQMPFAGSQPSGGFIGDAIVCTDIATGTWACDVQYQAGTTPTTPYSTSTT